MPALGTLHAAEDAAAFVAQIFAQAAPAGDAEIETVEVQAQEEAAPELPPVPAGWPQAEALPMADQQLLVLGLGASGLAMARWCARLGAQVTVADTRDNPPQRAVLQQELPQVRFVAGAFDAALLDGQNFTTLYRSPGLSPQQLAPVLEAAKAQGLRLSGELDLFALALQALAQGHGYQPRVLAITGTNGKTTVTSLTGQLLAHAGKSVAVAGNIGPTLLDTLSGHIDAGTLPEAWVLELSSFQLDAATGFSPTAATVLNISQDHLDWHGNLDAYAAAKARIFGNGLMVLNREDPAVMQMLPAPTRVKLQRPQERVHVTFGGDMPRRPGDFGIEVVAGMAWLVRALEADGPAKRARAPQDDLHIQRLMPADALRIRGRHNAINALAALALATAAGCALAPMLYGLREYRGEPHRVEPVGVVNEIEFFDDSKGTNVGATVAALTGLGADRRLVAIMGGVGKDQDFSPLAAPVARYARAVVLIGRDAPLIRAALEASGVPLLAADSMQQAVTLAQAQARPGEAVLMSPACASFDMFQDYEDRARQFVRAVQELAQDAGQDLEGWV
ncbi:UDP-N-acetylmuramoyl-L-alanine--D-glutamate ligase [Acidovorax sp. D4N7]|uniref:UDP-N-acetylmuramoylalanine--D-glutamate ligase n=2 Tax=Comamonas endophytica TaxID=2949090 RepID=A0ABY6GF59_9BURK|nr:MULTISPECIES: UDP-N-acetylmuramoyl-L-alanine--D-glutamate ligase [unclassified Acidovorax]MCD2511161.1 UDP-N-acetylmuramoyl-L-alanine--D-glutamate ligase [Acidovorax sp. D4N7]UYG53310.1 UDP-N-acetylmuramoyl-L-alanine--D-glutamate ligase [Acidovorax sp. 5MLIR]